MLARPWSTHASVPTGPPAVFLSGMYDRQIQLLGSRPAALVRTPGRPGGPQLPGSAGPPHDRLVERYGHGNRSEFLRAAMKIMAAEERAERLRAIQGGIHAQAGQIYSAAEVNELVRNVLKPRG